MERNEKITYVIISDDNQNDFERRVTEALNSENPKYELVGSLVIESNHFYQTLIETKKSTGNPYIHTGIE